jgi:hypothetical protein
MMTVVINNSLAWIPGHILVCWTWSRSYRGLQHFGISNAIPNWTGKQLQEIPISLRHSGNFNLYLPMMSVVVGGGRIFFYYFFISKHSSSSNLQSINVSMESLTANETESLFPFIIKLYDLVAKGTCFGVNSIWVWFVANYINSLRVHFLILTMG